jgi:DNA-binding transcriptional LysR family regulator
MQLTGRPATGRGIEEVNIVKFDLRDLEPFVAVADAGSIARAAERSHTVASAISKRISDLEESFGAPLLLRGAKGVELTAAGNALLKRARVLCIRHNSCRAPRRVLTFDRCRLPL